MGARRSAAVLAVAWFVTTSLAAEPPAVLEDERLDDPPGIPAADDAFARSPGLRVAFGSYQSIQINVDSQGDNIVGDAANEPSIAVNPLNPANMVVGWRQFDTVTSNFRQAGWAYTFDGGQSWTFPGVLTPGTFRSDPVLDVDRYGTFFYLSLKQCCANRSDVFQSADGGVSWTPPFPSRGGDKNWLVIDRSGSIGDAFLYLMWNRYDGCCGTNMFTRSSTNGFFFNAASSVPLSPTWGTMAVGPDGELYGTGIAGTLENTPDNTTFVVAKSTNAKDANVLPTFTTTMVDLGGILRSFSAPNPGGLAGQPNVLVNPAPGTRRGEVYLLSSIAGFDPMDVHLVRSQNGGATWSSPIRVNDDVGNNWQWMAGAAVAGNGRIDVVWLDTRNGPTMNVAQLFYAYSWDGGLTWSPNVAVTPGFDTSVGYPAQNKLGDYLGIVSDSTGAHTAYAATFNGEQDVYYVRLFPDCNGNGLSDVTDVAGSSLDCDANHVPDECQAAPQCLGAGAVGAGLTVERDAGGDLTLRWGASCGAGDDDYAVYEGTLGSFASHAPRACTTGGVRQQALTPAEGDTYYLVVPTHADREGSYGTASSGQRPAAVNACLPQSIQACSP